MDQEIWEQSWIEWVPPGHDLVTNRMCPQSGFTLPRRQFVTLNPLRCGQARCAESLYRWGVIASPACLCGESHQTTRHIVEECPLTALPGGLRRLHEAVSGYWTNTIVGYLTGATWTISRVSTHRRLTTETARTATVELPTHQ